MWVERLNVKIGIFEDNIASILAECEKIKRNKGTKSNQPMEEN